MSTYSGKIRNEFGRRLDGSWIELANELDIPNPIRKTWDKGREAEGIWEFLESQQKLIRLPHALRDIGRPDLAQIFEYKKESKGVHQVVSEILGLLEGTDSGAQKGSELALLESILQSKEQNKLRELSNEIKNELDAFLQQPLTEAATDQEREQLRNELPKYSGLEAAVVGASLGGEVFSGASFISKYQEASRRMCFVGFEYQYLGTGFLVAQNRIMTNYHVFDAANQAGRPLFAFFDHDGSKKISELPKYKIEGIPLASSIATSLDYVILELETSVDQSRGCFTLCDYRPQFREALHVLGHPGMQGQQDGKLDPAPLTLRSGILFDHDSHSKRIAYSAETLPGSSGSPVFRENFELIGIHHHGETGINNHGIPMWAIIQDLSQDQRKLVTIQSLSLASNTGVTLEVQGGSASVVLNTNRESHEKNLENLHKEIASLIGKLNEETIERLCSSFKLDVNTKNSREKLRRHIIEDCDLSTVLNKCRLPHSQASAEQKIRLREILVRLCPLRYDRELIEKLRDLKLENQPLLWLGGVRNKPIAEVVMAAVDGKPVMSDNGIIHPSIEAAPEIGYPESYSGDERSENEIQSFLREIAAQLGKRIGGKSTPRESSDFKLMLNDIKQRIHDVSEQTDERTIYCILTMPDEKNNRQQYEHVVRKVSAYLPELFFVEYNKNLDNPTEESFIYAYNWILDLDN